MKVHARSTRISGFFPVGVMTILAALLVSAAPSYGVAHKYPGTPMGPNGASGVVDSATNPRDMYSVYLFRGQEVGFDPTATAGDGFLSVTLYAPGPFGAEVAGNSMFSGILYTPAVSGTYSLEVTTDGNGEAYTIDVRGAESMPLTTATALSSPSRARVNKVLTVSGTVSPGGPAGRVKITRTHLVGITWKRVGSARVGVTAGAFSYSFTPKYRGKWHLVAKYLDHTVGDTTYTASSSRVKTVTVK